MSTTVGSLTIDMALNVARLTKSIDDGRKQVEAGMKRIGDTAEALQRTLNRTFAGVSLFLVAREFVKMADAMTLAEGRLRLVSKTQEDFIRAQKDIYAISQANNAGLKETTILYSRLADPVQRLGGSTREVSAIVEAFATSMRIGGASAQESAAATLQFSQAMASGKLNGDELRSLAEASPRFMRALADAIGVPTGALKDMGKDGKLTADVVGNALMKSLDQLKVEAQGLPDTVGGSFQRLVNDATVLVSITDKLTGATGGMASAMGGAALLVQSLSHVLEQELADGSKVAGSSFDTLGASMRVVGTLLEMVLLLSSDVSYVLKGMGREIGGIAAQAMALARGDWEGVKTIRASMVEDAKNAADELKRYQDRIAGLTDRALQTRAALASLEGTGYAQSDRKFGSKLTKLKPSGGMSEDDKKKAAKEAEEQRKLLAELSGVQGDYMEQLSRLQKLRVSQNMTDERYIALVTELIEKQPAARKQMHEMAEAQEKAAKEAKKAGDELAKKAEKEREEMVKRAEHAQEMLADLEFEKKLLYMTTEERDRAIISREMERKGIKKGTEAWDMYADAIMRANDEKMRTERDVKELTSIFESIDRTAQETWTNVWEGGDDAFKRIGKTLKAAVLDLLYQMTIKKWIIDIGVMASGQYGGAVGQALGGGSSGGGLGGLLNNNSGLISAGVQAFGGFSAGASAASLGYANMVGAAGGDALGALIAANGSWAGVGTAAAGGAAAGAGGAMSAIGAAMPYVGLAIAAFSLLSGAFDKKGGPKQDGVYGNIDSGIGLGIRSAQTDGAAQAQALALQSQYDSLVKVYGGKGGAQFGVGFSMDPQGDSQSFADVTLRSASGGTLYTGLNREAGRSQEELQAAITAMGNRAILTGLQQSGIAGGIGDYLRGLGDLANASAETINEAIARVQKAGQERATLEDRLFQLTATDLMKLNKVRDAERASVDSTNATLLKRIYAEEDLRAVGAKLSSAYQQELAFRTSMDQLRLSNLSPFSGSGLTAEARRQFAESLAGAKSGDADAKGRLSGAASAYLEQLRQRSRTRADYLSAYGQVTNDLDSVTATSAELDVAKKQLTELGYIAKNTEDFKTLLAAVVRARADAKALSVPGFADGGSFSGGLRVVGEDGWELEATGPSRVYSHDESMGMLRAAVGSDGVAAAMDRLTKEFSDMRAENRSLVRQTNEMAKSLKEIQERGVYTRNQPQGEPLKVTVV